jgi:hypothetical protein
MKQLFLVLVCLFNFPVSSFAQTTETFDIAAFQAPTGWNKQATQNAAQFSTEDKTQGTYCVITLFKSLPGIGSAKENFDAAWQTVVKTVVNPTAAPQMSPSDNKEDWQVVGGFAPFEKDGEKGVAVLYTASGYGKMVNALVLTNTQAYEAAITAFWNRSALRSLPRNTTANTG